MGNMLQVQVGGLNPMFKVGDKGDSTCPDGFVKIKDKDECNDAMKELELEILTNKKHIRKHRLPFCWMKKGKVHFNNDDDVGNKVHKMKANLICKREPEPECIIAKAKAEGAK